MNTDQTEPMLSVEDARQLLKFDTPRPIYRQIAAGVIPAVRLGKEYRIPASAIRRLCAGLPAVAP